MFRKLRARSRSIRWLGDGTKPPPRLYSLVEIADFDSQRSGNPVQPAGGHTIDALLVLVRLLVGDADQLGHLLLGQAEQDPALADPSADVAVDILWPGSALPPSEPASFLLSCGTSAPKDALV